MSYLTLKYNFKIKGELENQVRFLCHISKNVYNSTLYELRQHFFVKKNLMDYKLLLSKLSKNENYQILSYPVANKIMKNVYANMEKFIRYQDKPFAKLPEYLNKRGYYPIITNTINKVIIDNTEYVSFPLSDIVKSGKIFSTVFDDETTSSYLKMKEVSPINLDIPKRIAGKHIYQARIVPEYRANFFSVNYSYLDTEVSKYHGTKSMGIDLGLDNIASLVTTDNEAFVIDGRRAKSINRLYNTKIAYYNSKKPPKTPFTKRQLLTLRRRNLRIDDYFKKAARLIINLAQEKEIGEIVIGYNKQMKTGGVKNDDLSKKTKAIINQSYVGLPLFKFKDKIVSLAKRNNIRIVEIDESYTSKCSFYDNEYIGYHREYLGKREGRLFTTSKGIIVNADINAALNILAKSKPKGDENIIRLRNSGLVIPLRLQVH